MSGPVPPGADPVELTAADHAELTALSARYGMALDLRRWDDLRTVFTADAHIDYARSRVLRDGIDDVIAFFRHEATVPDATQHLMSTAQHWATGPDTAEGRTHVTAHHVARYAPRPAGPEHVYTVTATYSDRCLRTPDGWRIAARTNTVLTHTGDPAVLGR